MDTSYRPRVRRGVRLSLGDARVCAVLSPLIDPLEETLWERSSERKAKQPAHFLRCDGASPPSPYLGPSKRRQRVLWAWILRNPASRGVGSKASSFRFFRGSGEVRNACYTKSSRGDVRNACYTKSSRGRRKTSTEREKARPADRSNPVESCVSRGPYDRPTEPWHSEQFLWLIADTIGWVKVVDHSFRTPIRHRCTSTASQNLTQVLARATGVRRPLGTALPEGVGGPRSAFVALRRPESTGIAESQFWTRS